MARARTILTHEYPYHVYARVNHKYEYPIPLSEVWMIYLNELSKLKKELKFAVHAFVLMPNHFHMVVRTPDANLDQCMKVFMQNTTCKILGRAGRINRLYGGRYRWNLVQTEAYYACLIKYVYQNPLRANLCKNTNQYQFSTMRSRHVLESLDQEFSTLIPTKTKRSFQNWINSDLSEEFKSSMHRGLRRRVFKMPRTGDLADNGRRFL